LENDSAPPPLKEKPDPYLALRYPEFRNFTLARLVITLGSLMQAVIVGWQIYELTRDPLSLGLIGLAEAVPAILVALYAGHITDITDRKKILLSSYGLFILASVALFVIAIDAVGFLNANKVAAIYAALFTSGIARGFMAPSHFAFVSQLIPKEVLPNAITWNTSTWQTGAVAGPAVGGLVYGFFGAGISYFIIVVLICTGFALVASIKKKPLPEITSHTSLSERLTAGVKFVFKNKIMLGAMTLDLFAVLFGGAVALLPIFAGEILNAGPEGLGVLRAAPSIGAVIMVLAMTRIPLIKNAGRNLIIGVIGFGLCMIAFALSKNFYLSVMILVLSGMFDSVSVVVRSTIIQLETPENMKGRVSAVNSIFIGSSNEIGAFESGVAAKLLGVIPSVLLGGFMTLLVVGIVSYVNPRLRKLKI
jgi:MFS family permease